MLPIFFGIGIALLYAFLYYENQKTPRPEGCEIAEGGCQSCAQDHCDIRV